MDNKTDTDITNNDISEKPMTLAESNTINAFERETKELFGYDSSFDYDNGFENRDTSDSESIEQEEVNTMAQVVVKIPERSKQDYIMNNNLVYKVRGDGLGKTYIGSSSRYPPYMDPTKTAGAYTTDINNNVRITNSHYGENQSSYWNYKKDNYKFQDIQSNTDSTQFISNTTTYVDSKQSNCIVCALSHLHARVDDDNQIEEEDLFEDDGVTIKQKNTQWFVHIPMQYANGEVKETRVFADPGANAGCVNTDWAWEHFAPFIIRNSRSDKIATPGGMVSPNYILYLTFPTPRGIILKSKMYLMNELPVDMLCDINMLKAFGYKFKDEVPPIFRHDEEKDIDLELAPREEQLSVYKPMLGIYEKQKLKQLNHLRYHRKYDEVLVNKTQVFYNKLIGGNKVLYSDKRGSTITTETPAYDSESESWDYDYGDLLHPDKDESDHMFDDDYYESESEFSDEIIDSYKDDTKDKRYNPDVYSNDLVMCLVKRKDFDEILNIENVDYEIDLQPIRGELSNVSKTINHINYNQNRGKQFINDDLLDGDLQPGPPVSSINNITFDYYSRFNYKRENITNTALFHKIDHKGAHFGACPIYHKCLFLMSKKSFLADAKEIANADKKLENKLLKWNNLDYLKEYPRLYGKQFIGLYDAVTQWVKDNKHLFAKRTFSRRTMNVPYARLGIKEEHRDKTMFARQYPISSDKRLDMINYTRLNEANGFWKPIKFSMNCVPYTMVPKKRDGIITRYRPAFDGRVVNQYCQLMQSNMPLLKDFNELHSIKGLSTMADVKNCFDCIPLHPADRKYAVAHTPLGLYQMTCLTYGWMNAAPEAQKIMNQLALFVGLTLAYIDDICIKHPIKSGTAGIIAQLNKLALFVELHNIQLNPSKFYPAIDLCTSFSFSYSLIGKMVSKSYRKKLLDFAKPKTKADADTFLGALLYCSDFIFDCAMLVYWIRKLKSHLVDDPEHPGKKVSRLKWTPEANVAWGQIKELLKQLPVLHHPTPDGQFVLQTDACNYGIGAVLWQKQFDKKKNQQRWKVVDMWSKQMPPQLRHCHSMVHEAYAIVAACEHWQFHLLKRRFIVSTDNQPVANIFKSTWKDLSFITQKQLIRLRSKLSMFAFDSYHVPGLENKMADALSRCTVQLTTANGLKPTLRVIESDDTGHRKLSDIEKAELNHEFETIENKRDRLRKEVSRSVNNLSLLPQDMVLNRSQNISSHRNDHNIKIRKYRSFLNLTQSQWESILTEYQLKSNYLERERIDDLINSAKQETITSDENSFGDATTSRIQTNYAQLLHTTHNITTTTKSCLAHVLKYQTDRKLRQYKALSNFNYSINVVDKEGIYDPTEDIQQLPSKERKYRKTKRITTRSVTRRRKRKETKEDIENKYLNAEFEDSRNRIKTRDDFVTDIFGHRRDLDIFNVKAFVKYQKDDNHLNLLRKLIQLKPTDRSEVDMQFLFRFNPYLYERLLMDKIRINEKGVLQARDYHTSKNKNIWKHIVPFNIRGKLMDYYHHNLQLHHFHFQHTFDDINARYWWGTIKKDVKSFCERCVSCQFTKGGIRHRAPMRIRQLSKPRQHLFADFLGSVFGKYYILVLVDYATGYTMLIPTHGTDAATIVDSILKNWIPIFGWFTTFESDWGSGFNSQIIKALTKAGDIKFEMAEPRNHRSIGKVERIIGFLQKVINQYNLLLDEQLTTSDFDEAWRTIETMLPYIQLSFNQRRPRFTTYSPNMLMFGSNLTDISDIDTILQELKTIKNDDEFELKDQDYHYLENLIKQIKNINLQYRADWMKYTKETKKQFDNRYKVNDKQRRYRYKRQFAEGKEVLYFVGDRELPNRKWRQRWTGPWLIDKCLNDSTVIIGDHETGNQKRVSIDRLKPFNSHTMEEYKRLMDSDINYINYQQRLHNQFKQYNVKRREKGFELDYNENK